ncbi:hypothetical protein ACFS2C_05075 [Prauserella oleivorans]|uniref:Lipoprotein n=1 Tax=Prauserella oleivorans TaxID=1478153 RepID=A0ABW5W495_9PSEU
MRARIRLAGLIAGVAALTVACGGGESAPADQAPSGAPSSRGPAGEDYGDTGQAGRETPVADDVEVTGCAQTAWSPKVVVKVTNSTSRPQRYAATVTISNPGGDSTEAYFAKNRLEPGQAVTDEIMGSGPVAGELTCEVTEAKRLPPK